jgi:hypothetical protein
MHPEYPSAHSILASAVGAVLKAEIGNRPMPELSTTSPTAKGVTRRWNRIDDFVREVSNARIYEGVHYRFSTDVGMAMGQQIGEAAVARHLPASSAAVPAALEPVDGWLSQRVVARGVQIYECRALPGAAGRAQWAFVAPEAELLDAGGTVAGKHYAGPHWEALDGSKIVGAVKARADAPQAGAIPWLLLSAKSVGGPGRFAQVTSVQRIHTVGGAAPAKTCDGNTLGAIERVPYSADYVLFSS